jgi:hypothetical protein
MLEMYFFDPELINFFLEENKRLTGDNSLDTIQLWCLII